MEPNFMKALVFQGPKQFEVKEVPIPQCGADEMLVRVRFAGVCGTDNRIYQGTKVIAAPRITGHEFSGTIERLGSHVKGYQLGQRVSVYPMLYCGHCYCCREGRTNICVNRTTIGYEIDGGFAQYVKIPKRAIECGNVVPIPDNVSDEIAAISEPIAAAYHGMQQAGLRDGETFVIIGAGPIGLFHTSCPGVWIWPAGSSLNLFRKSAKWRWRWGRTLLSTLPSKTPRQSSLNRLVGRVPTPSSWM